MARLVYSAICSVDGYTVDADGRFEWAAPDEEVHAFVNDLERPVGTYLYGRRMYETMVSWETDDDQAPANASGRAVHRITAVPHAYCRRISRATPLLPSARANNCPAAKATMASSLLIVANRSQLTRRKRRKGNSPSCGERLS